MRLSPGAHGAELVGTRRRRHAGAWVAAAAMGAALAVSGCGPDRPPRAATPTPAPASGTPTSPSTAPEPSAPPPPTATPEPSAPPPPTAGAHRPGPREVLVELNVSGGYAGVNNRLIVHYDGSHTTRSGTGPPRHGRMTPAEVARLRAALEDPAYAAVPARPTGKPVFDGFRYVVAHRYRVVVADDGAVPAALARVFDALPGGGPPTST
ncbi:hypothetical protein [Streptomyces sp. NPDC053755]|uniref:hypothetical protein n=1 Tax=Streptomyces sp. NPDC053755 TaxID=3155815 RepID=UPI00344A880C